MYELKKITSFTIKDEIFDSLIRNPKQGLLQNVAIKKNGCHRNLFLLFETVLSCSDPEWTSIKEVVLVWKTNGF